MDRLFRTLYDFYRDIDFRKFQNSFARELYENIGASYSNSYNEVKMVTELCNTINGKSYQNLKFHTKKIHGSRSFVEFYNKDKPSTKELADMVIISIATRESRIIFEKTAFIQNKKEDDNNQWKIDLDQLYLLRNFPTFKGNRGIFKRNFNDEVVFFNNSKTLGNYGLFQFPGEMIIANAHTIFKVLQNDKVVFNDLKNELDTYQQLNNSNVMDYRYFEEILHRFYKFHPAFISPFFNLPFLGNNTLSLNIYDFVRNWTLFNIGEIVSLFGNIVNSDLYRFNQIMLKEVGLKKFLNNNLESPEFGNNMVVIVSHLDLDEMIKE